MTTNAYWAAAEQVAPTSSAAFWAEVIAATAPTIVYWVELEATSEIGDAVTGFGTIPEVTTITLVGTGTLLVGGTLDLTVTVEDQDGDPIANVSPVVTSSNTGVATIALIDATDANGEATARVTGVAGGTVSFTASLDGLTTTAAVIPVNWPPDDEEPPIEVVEVTTVTLSVPSISLEVGTTGSASVLVLDQNGDPVGGVTVTWSSSTDAVIADPASSTTSAAGTATVALPALAAGTTSIGATVEGVSATPVTVTVIAVADPPTYSGSGSAQIIVTAESRLAGWERPRVRRFNDADQKKQYPTDRFFEGMVEGVEVEVVWPNREVLRRYA